MNWRVVTIERSDAQPASFGYESLADAVTYFRGAAVDPDTIAAHLLQRQGAEWILLRSMTSR